THECLNSLLWGPDGWLYGLQGVFNLGYVGKPGSSREQRHELRAGVWRYHPIRNEFEVFAHGGSNPWGLDYDERGQLFMTHCRSFFGGGCTTHVIQGGHFWNQANANYAPFIIGDPPSDHPQFRNYLLASARYDHGAGGAGKPGSDAIYGGHSHVGTMIYLGDNWPDDCRGHLFTHNLGGHQMNRQVNRLEHSGYQTVHAGQDQFFCTDPAYVPVDLQYGPDGAVYVIDWYDIQHCHHPNMEKWDRGNGRIYRLSFQSTFSPRKVDLSSATDVQLVEFQRHKNQWYARVARRLLHERSFQRSIDSAAAADLRALFRGSNEPQVRLNALWGMHLTGAASAEFLTAALRDPNPDIRGWAIQLLAEPKGRDVAIENSLIELATKEPDASVRLRLASAIQRVSDPAGWRLTSALAQRMEDVADRNLPLLVWHGAGALMARDIPAGLMLASETAWPWLAEFCYWRAASLSMPGLEGAIGSLADQDEAILTRRLAGLILAVEGRGFPAPPAAWTQQSKKLLGHANVRIRRSAELLAAALGDHSSFARHREDLGNKSADEALRKHSFEVLSRGVDPLAMNVFIGLLDEPGFRPRVITTLGAYEHPRVPEALISRMRAMKDDERFLALGALTRRESSAVALAEAVSSRRVPKEWINALHVRQLAGFNHPQINLALQAHWGRIGSTPESKLSEINRLEKVYNEAPLWAYEATAGKALFGKLCAACHRVGEAGNHVGPPLTGVGRHGVRYLLENIIDPNAVVGRDYQSTTITRVGGDVLTGSVTARYDDAIMLRTVTGDQFRILKTDIVSERLSESSLMPEGLLEALPAREQIELMKFLMSQ
ncbi:MAG: c-type cytochrome, partial [Verrucomicrobia bacterium]|nr:c-type cytochrome [Verrucomicrobiota bacterium]